MVRNEICNW